MRTASWQPRLHDRGRSLATRAAADITQVAYTHDSAQLRLQHCGAATHSYRRAARSEARARQEGRSDRSCRAAGIQRAGYDHYAGVPHGAAGDTTAAFTVSAEMASRIVCVCVTSERRVVRMFVSNVFR